MSKMKLEDQNYLTLKAVEEAKKIDRLQSNLHLGTAPSIASGGSGSHTLFLDDEDAVKNFDAVEHFDTVPELVGRAHDRPRKSALATARIMGPTDQVCVEFTLAGPGSRKRNSRGDDNLEQNRPI
jgi:hypothetical protein